MKPRPPAKHAWERPYVEFGYHVSFPITIEPDPDVKVMAMNMVLVACATGEAQWWRIGEDEESPGKLKDGWIDRETYVTLLQNAISVFECRPLLIDPIREYLTTDSVVSVHLGHRRDTLDLTMSFLRYEGEMFPEAVQYLLGNVARVIDRLERMDDSPRNSE
jgi:hypothetical protein